MRKTASFPPRYWTSTLARSVIGLGHQYQSVITYLVTGPYSHVSGIYGLQVYQMADDLQLDPDEARHIVATLANLGWCTFEPPVIWIHGFGCQADQLARDFRQNTSDLIATLRHIESLPEDNGAVIAWRAAHDLTGMTADDARRRHASTQGPGIRHEPLGTGIGNKSDPTGRTTRRTTRRTTGNGALREGQP